MKISEALSQARQALDSNGVSNSRLDSLILLSHAISFTKEQVIFNPDLELSLVQQKAFFELIERRKEREPISHIINKREFYGADFFVCKDVLDPRPDSETLIEAVLKQFPEKNQKLEILELGVGSGCLIITLLRAYDQAHGIAVDISEEALKVAQKNSENLKVSSRLELKKSDLFAELNPQKKFDLIISNPPYIPSKDIDDLEPEVKTHEPLSALDGGADGLDFYRRIAENSADFLKENGIIFLEIGFGQREEVVEIFLENELMFLGASLDLSGIERVLEFKKK